MEKVKEIPYGVADFFWVCSTLTMTVTKALSSNHYYGMLTIKGTRGSKLVLGIPNNNVRKQYYGYLEEEYQAICSCT